MLLARAGDGEHVAERRAGCLQAGEDVIEGRGPYQGRRVDDTRVIVGQYAVVCAVLGQVLFEVHAVLGDNLTTVEIDDEG